MAALRSLSFVAGLTWVLAQASFAQVTVAWSSPITANPLPSSARSLWVDAQGRSFVAGDRPEPGQLPGQPYASLAHLACIDAQGALLWEHTFGIFGEDTNYFVDVAVDAAGRSVAAESRAVVSYDAGGALLWSWTAGAVPLVWKKVLLDAAGNAYLIGTVQVTTSDTDMLFEKFSPGGSLVASGGWAGSTGHFDYPFDAALDTQGNLYVTGKADALGSAGDFVLLELDAALNLSWTYTAPAGIPPETSVACGPSGEAYVAGIDGFSVARIDPNGVLAWRHSVTDATHDHAQAGGIVVDPHGDVIAAGAWGPLGQFEGVVRKYDPAGNEVWTRTVVGSGQSSANQIDVDEGGDVVIGGRFLATQTTSATDFAARYDRDGNLAWLFLLGIGIGPLPDTVHVGPGMSTFWAYGNLRRLESDVVSVCFGDGSATACPCGNASPGNDRSGCTNSLGSAGRLAHSGFAFLANDTMVLTADGMPNAAALFFQGTTLVGGGAGGVFGDGLRCAGGAVVRLGTKNNAAGSSTYPGAGDPSLSVGGMVTAPGTRMYQVWYRNAAAFCTPLTFNLTNALRVAWSP